MKNQNIKILKILLPALALTIGLDFVSAFYTPKPSGTPTSSNVANSNTPLSVLFANSANNQSRIGRLALGSNAAPTATLDVRGTMFSRHFISFGNTNVGMAAATSSGGMSLTHGDISAKDVYLSNLTINGKPGRRKLCANGSGVLDVCPPEKGFWYTNVPGSHTFNTSILPPGVETIKVELWGGGGNSVPRTDPNPGNDKNNTNPADPSFLRVYSGSTPTTLVMHAESGRMGYGTTTWGTTMQTGGEGGRGYINGVEQSSARGSSGQNPSLVTPSIFSASGGYSTSSACVGGSGGTSGTAALPAGSKGFFSTGSSNANPVTIGSSGMTFGGYGGAGGARTGTTNGRGLSPNTNNFGAGGGGFGRESTLASAVFCTTQILVGGKFVTPMSGGGGAGAKVTNTYNWSSLPENAIFQIEIGEGGINNHDWMTGNGANGGVLITW
jgi:hypothetical protein